MFFISIDFNLCLFNTHKHACVHARTYRQEYLLLALLSLTPILNFFLLGAECLLPFPQSDPNVTQPFWLPRSFGSLAWATFLGQWFISCSPCLSLVSSPSSGLGRLCTSTLPWFPRNPELLPAGVLTVGHSCLPGTFSALRVSLALHFHLKPS